MSSGPSIPCPSYFRLGSKILGVLRNFRSHALELGNPIPTKPVFFLKPASSISLSPSPSGDRGIIRIPPELSSVSYEVELAVIIGVPGSNITRENALNHVAGYSVAIDVTSRDWQNEAKKGSLPWTQCKGADTFCGLPPALIPAPKIPNVSLCSLTLSINGSVKQDGSLSDMIFDVPELISAASRYYTLEVGDILLTGTPSGVGPMTRGDILTASLRLGSDVLSSVEFSIV